MNVSSSTGNSTTVEEKKEPSDDRKRLEILTIMALGFALVVVTCIGLNALSTTAGEGATKRSFSVFVLYLWLAVLVIAIGLANILVDRWWHVVGHAMRILKIFGRTDEQRKHLDGEIDLRCSKPLRPVGAQHFWILRLEVALFAVSIVLVSHRTGGFFVSPFLHIGATLFLLGMVLTEAASGRMWLGLAAVGSFVLVHYFDSEHPQSHFRGGWWAGLVYFNLILQIVVGIAASSKIRGSDKKQGRIGRALEKLVTPEELRRSDGSV